MTDSPELLHAAGLADAAGNRARDLSRGLQALAVELRQGSTNPGAVLKRIGHVANIWEDLQLLMRAGRLVVTEKDSAQRQQGDL